MKLRHSWYLLFFVPIFFNRSFVFSQELTNSENSENFSLNAATPPYEQIFKTYFLNLSSIYDDLAAAAIDDLFPPPIEGTIECKEDQDDRKNAVDNATKNRLIPLELQ